MSLRKLIHYFVQLRSAAQEIFITREEDEELIKEIDLYIEQMRLTLTEELLEKIHKQIEEDFYIEE